MHFQPLRSEDLFAVQRIAAELFPWEDEHQLALPAAVDPVRHAAFYLERRLASVRCWTGHNDRAEVCGLATLYGYQAQPDEVWLAWFGLVSEARGLGAGRELLDFLVRAMQSEGRRTLRLWTTDEPEYAAATGIYQKRGFVVEDYPALPGEDWRTLVFSLGLDGRLPVPWSAVLDRGELCGRQAPVRQRVAA